jgi:hypothetical protein
MPMTTSSSINVNPPNAWPLRDRQEVSKFFRYNCDRPNSRERLCE